MRKPLVIDLYAGLGGWADGFLAEGWDAIGFDDGSTAPYSSGAKYPGQLVIQDCLTLHGSQFRNVDCIVASPPCTRYSWLAMPWSRSTSEHSQAAKALRRKWETEGPDNRLFDACFRIRREASEAAGRYIPLIVENVRGAQPWVGRAAWSYGSFYLWGDVPALMPVNLKRIEKLIEGTKSDRENGGWFNDYKGEHCVGISRTGSKSHARKAASAQIAKVPLALAQWIAQVYKPKGTAGLVAGDEGNDGENLNVSGRGSARSGAGETEQELGAGRRAVRHAGRPVPGEADRRNAGATASRGNT